VHAFNWMPKMAQPAALEPPAAREALIRQAVTDARTVAPGLPIEVRSFEGSAVTALLRRARTAVLTVIGDGDLLSATCLPRDALTVQVAARAASTVLVTRAATAEDGPVVVGANGSAASRRALEFAFDAAARRKVPLIVVRACANDDDATCAGPAVAALEHHYALTADVRIINGDPGVVLRKAAQEAGLVVVGARGGRPYHGLLGWIAQTMLHHSPAPVALVRGLMPDA
jgi:nucleotide-binding universal stress UspA family protein